MAIAAATRARCNQTLTCSARGLPATLSLSLPSSRCIVPVPAQARQPPASSAFSRPRPPPFIYTHDCAFPPTHHHDHLTRSFLLPLTTLAPDHLVNRPRIPVQGCVQCDLRDTTVPNPPTLTTPVPSASCAPPSLIPLSHRNIKQFLSFKHYPVTVTQIYPYLVRTARRPM